MPGRAAVAKTARLPLWSTTIGPPGRLRPFDAMRSAPGVTGARRSPAGGPSARGRSSANALTAESICGCQHRDARRHQSGHGPTSISSRANAASWRHDNLRDSSEEFTHSCDRTNVGYGSTRIRTCRPHSPPRVPRTPERWLPASERDIDAGDLLVSELHVADAASTIGRSGWTVSLVSDDLGGNHRGLSFGNTPAFGVPMLVTSPKAYTPGSWFRASTD